MRLTIEQNKAFIKVSSAKNIRVFLKNVAEGYLSSCKKYY